jgi:hypothetical protein
MFETNALLDHRFTVAAYAITWVIQLGYLAWMSLKSRALKRCSAPSSDAQSQRQTHP